MVEIIRELMAVRKSNEVNSQQVLAWAGKVDTQKTKKCEAHKVKK